MRTIDEKIELPFDVDKDDLIEIAEKLGVNIDVKNDVIVIEGDEAELDEAAGMIAQLQKKQKQDIDMPDDPYADLDVGQRYSDKKGYLPAKYSVYDLISFDEDSGLWNCDVITYWFELHPYKIDHVSHSKRKVDPAELIEMKKTKRRK